MSNLLHSEIETKYDASDIPLSRFVRQTRELPEYVSEKTNHIQQVSSYDHYYTRDGKAIRYREGAEPQLTVKEKTSKTNNVHRVEVNIDISSHTTKGDIDKFCATLGFEADFSIFKESTILWYDKFNTVYYIVWSDHHKTKELGRFIEIELKEHFPWDSTLEAYDYLNDIEKRLKPLGISRKLRLNKSLYEMFTQSSKD